MRRSNQIKLGDAVKDALNKSGLGKKMMEFQVTALWGTDKIHGDMAKSIAKHTQDIYIKNKTLYVKMDSAVLREELSYGKSELLGMLNEEVGSVVVESVVLR